MKGQNEYIKGKEELRRSREQIILEFINHTENPEETINLLYETALLIKSETHNP